MVRPTAPGGFVFQWFAQRVCGVGVGFGFNGPPNGPGRGFGFFFSMVRPTGLRGRGRFFSMVRPTGLRGRGRFFSMVRPTGPGGVSVFFFQWSAQRAREEFRIFFFNGPPNGPGRGFVFQWSAQRAREGFRFSMVRPTGLRGRGRFFSMVRPMGPGGVSDFLFQWSAQRARWSAQRVCGVGVGFFQWGRVRFHAKGDPQKEKRVDTRKEGVPKKATGGEGRQAPRPNLD